ncbi:hypothetical protein AB1N83_012061 [Pleurotus pulmonarius]
MSLFSSLLCCCTRTRRDSLDSVDERTQLLANEQISQDRVDAPPDQDVIDHQRLRDRLEAVVREKEGKLINISNPLPFNFHNRPVIPTAYDASSSRSTSASVERYHYSSHYPSRETEPGPSAPMLAPSHSNYLLDNTGHAIGGDTDSDEAHGRALQAHIRNPILGIRLVEPADAVKGKGVEGERGRGAWAHTPVPSTSGPREQESGASFADGPHGDLDAEDEEMTPRASALVAKTQTSSRISPSVKADLDFDVGELCVSWND